jgi:hypothetical protein
MIATTNIFDEVAGFLASLSAERVLAYQVSASTKQRLSDLLEKQQSQTLSEEERREVEHHLIINNIIN